MDAGPGPLPSPPANHTLPPGGGALYTHHIPSFLAVTDSRLDRRPKDWPNTGCGQKLCGREAAGDTGSWNPHRCGHTGIRAGARGCRRFWDLVARTSAAGTMESCPPPAGPWEEAGPDPRGQTTSVTRSRQQSGPCRSRPRCRAGQILPTRKAAFGVSGCGGIGLHPKSKSIHWEKVWTRGWRSSCGLRQPWRAAGACLGHQGGLEASPDGKLAPAAAPRAEAGRLGRAAPSPLHPTRSSSSTASTAPAAVQGRTLGPGQPPQSGNHGPRLPFLARQGQSLELLGLLKAQDAGEGHRVASPGQALWPQLQQPGPLSAVGAGLAQASWGQCSRTCWDLPCPVDPPSPGLSCCPGGGHLHPTTPGGRGLL